MSDTLRSRLTRLAYDNPDLRPELVPLLKSARGNHEDLMWAAKEIEKATDKLGDVVLILDSRGSSGGDYEADEALSDVHREVAQTVDLIGRLSEMPDKLRRLR